MKLLQFRDYKNYRFDIESGNAYRYRFHKSGLSETELDIIKDKYLLYNNSVKSLSLEYQVSEHTIYNILKTQQDKRWIKMKPGIRNSGHLFLILRHKNGKIELDLHRIICELVNGPCPDGMECCHNDGNPYNNCYSNLRWDTRSSNFHDRILHGVGIVGEKCYNAKLKNIDIKMIFMLNNFCTQKEIAKIYEVDPSVISRIICKKRWRFV